MTLFEKIANGDVHSFKLYEDDEYLAILDKFPIQKGQVLVFPKKAYSSQFSEVPAVIASGAIQIAQDIAKRIENNVEDVARVIVVIEGFEVDHFHVKLIPTYHPAPMEDTPTHGKDKLEPSDDELESLRKLIASD